MTVRAYYNEHDPYAAAWLRNLISAGHIAPGDVDERSIVDVKPDDLKGYTQCHFFAGVGVWSHALRRAGWPDNRPVWTGSCPCQPFSAAGKGGGFNDERHLWPVFSRLIAKRMPAIVLGEQVASKDANTWIDLVQSDLEALGYAVGAVPFPAAGVGAPHIRDRLYWMADASFGGRRQECADPRRRTLQDYAERFAAGLMPGVFAGWMADADNPKWWADRAFGNERDGAHAGRAQGTSDAEGCGELGGLADADGRNAGAEGLQRGGQHGQRAQDGVPVRGADCGLGDHARSELDRPGPINGIWRDADWLGCTDGKWRPVEPGTFPLAHGASARMGRLRAYGNGLCAEAATVFIEAVMEAV